MNHKQVSKENREQALSASTTMSFLDKLIEESYQCTTIEAHNALQKVSQWLESRLKEREAFYRRQSKAAIDEMIAHNYEVRADVVSIIFEELIGEERWKK